MGGFRGLGWEEMGAQERLEPMRPLSLVAATDGNHGRAVARVARLLGLGAKIFVPVDMVTGAPQVHRRRAPR